MPDNNEKEPGNCPVCFQSILRVLSETFPESKWHIRIAYDKKVPDHNKINLWVPEVLLLRSSVDRYADF